MSKSFSAAPKPRLQPTAEEIEAFESGGVGHDESANVGTHKPTNVKTEPTKRLSIDLPASVHTRFKTACSATSTKMVAELLQFIEHRTTELEAEAGINR